jgi:hypothetical protein
LEALAVNQVKSFKALADGKDVFIGTKTGSGIFAYITATSTRIQSEDVLHGAHVVDEM